MKLSKLNLLVVGLIAISIGFFIIYFEDYKNNITVEFSSILFIGLGWLAVYGRLAANLKKRSKILGFVGNVLLFGSMAITIYSALKLSEYRIERILNDEPSKITIAEVTGTEIRHSRGSTSYWAIFQYEAGKETVAHSVHESTLLDYVVSQKYEIRYSIEYPEMFKIIKKIP